MEIGKNLRSNKVVCVSLLVFWAVGFIFAADCRAQDPAQSHYVRQANKDSVIVFVHGVLGDSRSTWTNSSTKAYWPALIKDDPYFKDFDIFVIEYPARFFHSNYTVDELVEVLRRDVDSAEIFTKHKRVYFLCHSMGGLVVRGYLTRYQNRTLQVPMIYFFSTPTTGTEAANIGILFSRNREMSGLLPTDATNEYLASIQKDWLAARFPIASYCAYETQDTYGIRIVDKSSATNPCDRRLDPINANHQDIVKPSDTKDAPYIVFQNAMKEVQPESIKKQLPPSAEVTKGIASPIEGLSNLGWAVNPGTPLTFNNNLVQISIRKSVKYFCAMKSEFNIVIVGAKNLDGVSGLREATHLKDLDLVAPELSDLSELKDLHNLEHLHITQTATISDLSPLQGLTNLKDLGLGSAGIRDLTPIQNLLGITTLQIDGAQVSDLSPLRNLHSLRELGLTRTRVTDLSPLQNLRSLRELNLVGTMVTDLSPMSKFDTLEELRVSGRQLPGLHALRNLTNLKKLSLFGPEPVDLSPIGELENLEALQIDGPQFLNLAPLRRLSKLSILSLKPQFAELTTLMQLQDIAALGELHGLKKLVLFQVLITDLSFMRELRNLKEFIATEVPLSNINGIEDAAALTTVQFTRTNVVDISPLLRLPNLTELYVEYAPARSDVLTVLERHGVKVHR